jgi:hypothetical protein
VTWPRSGQDDVYRFVVPSRRGCGPRLRGSARLRALEQRELARAKLRMRVSGARSQAESWAP